MNKKDDRVYLHHILDAIGRIEEYLEGVDKDTFWQQHLIQDGLIRQEQIIGEAVRRLSADLKREYPDVPWQDIAGMRSKLVHDYFGVDLDAVWLTAVERVPTLKEQVQQVLNALQQEEDR